MTSKNLRPSGEAAPRGDVILAPCQPRGVVGNWYSDCGIVFPRIGSRNVQTDQNLHQNRLNGPVPCHVLAKTSSEDAPSGDLIFAPCEEGRYEATWKRGFKLPRHKTGPLKSSRSSSRPARQLTRIRLSWYCSGQDCVPEPPRLLN